jgi:hypothetical protein
MKEKSMLELLLIRQWLTLFSNTTNIESKYIRQALKKIIDVDKKIWSEIISKDTPWNDTNE